MKKRFRNVVLLCACALSIVALGGCSMQKMAGNAVIEYSHDEAIPYLMSQGDLASACQMGQAMGPVLMSFHRVPSVLASIELFGARVIRECAHRFV